jgi:rod shape-determining protein MreC
MLDIRRRTLYLFLLVSFGHVLLISVQVQSKAGTPVVEAVAFGVFARVQGLTAAVAGTGRSLWSRYVALHGVVAENEQLRRHIRELEGQLQQEQAIASSTRSLEGALHLQASVIAPTLAARVVAGDASPAALTITIDRGSADGVQPDMAVLASRGVVGRVIGHPTPHAAHVQLLIGRTAAAAVVFERTGSGGIVEGGAVDPPLHVEFVSDLQDIRPGDRVLTSGEDGMFPRGFLVGTVERAERGSGQFRSITVRPAVDFSHLDIVLVVLAKPVKVTVEGGGA